MATGVLRSQLLSDVRQHADRVGDNAVTDAELNRWIDQSAKALHDEIIDASGALYQMTTWNSALTPGTSNYQITVANFYQLKAIRTLIGGVKRELQPYSMQDADYLNVPGDAFGPRVYRLYGTQQSGATDSGPWIDLFPTPTASGTFSIDYIPSYSPNPSGSDPSFDGINGWEDYVVWDVVAQIKDKLEEDPSYALRQLARQQERIKRLRAKRDAANPGRVRDVRRDAPWLAPRGPWWPLCRRTPSLYASPSRSRAWATRSRSGQSTHSAPQARRSCHSRGAF